LQSPRQADGGGGLADAALHAQGQQRLRVGHGPSEANKKATHGNQRRFFRGSLLEGIVTVPVKHDKGLSNRLRLLTQIRQFFLFERLGKDYLSDWVHTHTLPYGN
jgi:hypothetical protein